MTLPSTTVSVTFRDDKGSRSVMTLYLNSYPGTPQTSADHIQTQLQALTTGIIDTVQLSRTYQYGGNPTANSDVEEKGLFGFLNVDALTVLSSIPAFDESKLLPNSAEIDTTDSDVAAWITTMTSTTGVPDGGLGTYTVDGRNAPIVSLKYAREVFRGRRGPRRT